jgi:hypothetical protein
LRLDVKMAISRHGSLGYKRRPMTKTFSIVPLLVVPFIACGGGGDSHTVTIVDSHLGSGSGSGSNVTCEAASSYTPAGAFGSANSRAGNSPAAGSGSAATIHFEYLDGTLQGSDILDITLYAGYGGFGSGDIANGTYALTGNDADWGLCGICVDVMPGALGSAGIDFSPTYYATHAYIATAGSITFTSTTTSLTGVTFKHFNYDSSAGTSTFPDSCTTTIASATFDDVLQTGSGSGSANFTATGTAEGGLKVQFRLGNRHR